MSEYQRFISYMYEYRGNNRFSNCGYARIDNRNQLLKLEIHMKISSQSAEEPIHIYGCFQRDGQLYGVELGQHIPALGMVNWRIQCSALGLSGTDISFSDLEGLILTDQSPLSYCSIWNDQSIRPLDMIPYPSPESEMVSGAETNPKNNENDVSKNASDAEATPFSAVDNFERENTVPNTMTDTGNHQTSSDPAKNNAEQSRISSGSSAENNTFQTDSADPAIDIPRRGMNTSSPGTAGVSPNPETSDNSSESSSGNLTRPAPDTPAQNNTADSDDTASPAYVTSMPRTSPTLVEKIMAQEYKMPRPESFSKSPSPDDANNTSSSKPSTPSRWERLISRYPRSDAFSEGELKNCVRVEPRDFPRLRREGWNIAGNRFILHCFQRNAHCLIGRIGDTEQYVFAVPGIYDNQERFMANMFGFPCFKSADPDIPLTNGQKGYWYRSLH